MDEAKLLKELSLPFPSCDVEWRVQKVINESEKKGIAVPYLTSRAVQNRLDEVVGPMHWRSEYKPWHSIDGKASQLCGISIFFDERSEWITKWDGSDDSDFEPIKGGLSDAFKRAAVPWGIGRYLYRFDAEFVKVKTRGKNFVVDPSELPRLERIYNNQVASIFGTAAVEVTSSAKPQPAFKYVVRQVQKEKFGLSVVLSETKTGQDLTAFAQSSSQGLAEGICLMDATLKEIPANGNIPAYRILEDYQVAA